jgi:serine/threonine protein kinase
MMSREMPEVLQWKWLNHRQQEELNSLLSKAGFCVRFMDPARDERLDVHTESRGKHVVLMITVGDSCKPKESPLNRSLEAFIVLKGRLSREHVQVVLNLEYHPNFGSHAAAAQVFMDPGLILNVLSVEEHVGDGTTLLAAFHKSRRDKDVYPDTAREVYFQVLRALAYIHSVSMAVGGVYWNTIFQIIRAGSGLTIVIGDLKNALVGMNNRQYDFLKKEDVPAAAPESAKHLLAKGLGVTWKAITNSELRKTMITEDVKDHTLGLSPALKLLLPGPDGPIKKEPGHPVAVRCSCTDAGHEKTQALQIGREFDVQSVGIMMCEMLDEDALDESKLNRLRSATDWREVEQILNCSGIKQPLTMQKLLEFIPRLVTEDTAGRLSAESAAKSNAMQRPFLNQENEEMAKGNGIPVPGGPVPLWRLKSGGCEQAPPLLIKTGKMGLAVFADADIMKEGFVTSYAGEENSEGDPFSVHTVMIERQFRRLVGRFSSTWTLDKYIKEQAVGHLLNSS